MKHQGIAITLKFKPLQFNGINIDLFCPKKVLFFLHFAGQRCYN
jgi:hypothetical protein